MSFHIGQIVVHNADGICTIMSETEMYGMNFYLLIPKYDPNAKIYIPIDQADDYIRRLLTVKEADELIDYIGTIDDSLVDS